MRIFKGATILALGALALTLGCKQRTTETTSTDQTASATDRTYETAPGTDQGYQGRAGMTGTEPETAPGVTGTDHNTTTPSTGGGLSGLLSTRPDAKVTAKLVDQAEVDMKGMATIDVDTTGANLGTPGKLGKGESLISYKVD